MRLRDLINEMFTAGDLNPAMQWDETPGDVKDSQSGEPSKLPIEIPDEFKGKKKKKRKVRRKK